MSSSGFAVTPAQVRAAAGAVRGDAGAVTAAGSAVGAATGAAAGACGGGPLAGALARFRSAAETAAVGMGDVLEQGASALDESAASYVTKDQGAAAGLGGLLMGGVPPGDH